MRGEYKENNILTSKTTFRPKTFRVKHQQEIKLKMI